MSTQDNHLNHLKEIRGMMEKSTKFLSLSGLSGVFAGIFALLGALAAFIYFDSGNIKYDEYYNVLGDTPVNALRFLLIDGLVVLTLAMLSGYYFSRRKAKKMKVSFWNPSAKQMMLHLLLPLLAGGFIILILLWRNQMNFIPSFTLIFYGLGLISASKFSTGEIFYLGVFEVITGLLSLVFCGYDLYFWAFGFGVLHILYGSIMYFRYDKQSA